MSYGVKTGSDTLSRGQNHSVGGQVSRCASSAFRRPESSFRQSDPYGSLKAPRTGPTPEAGVPAHRVSSSRPRTTFTDPSRPSPAEPHSCPVRNLRHDRLDSHQSRTEHPSPPPSAAQSWTRSGAMSTIGPSGPDRRIPMISGRGLSEESR